MIRTHFSYPNVLAGTKAETLVVMQLLTMSDSIELVENFMMSIPSSQLFTQCVDVSAKVAKDRGFAGSWHHTQQKRLWLRRIGT